MDVYWKPVVAVLVLVMIAVVGVVFYLKYDKNTELKEQIVFNKIMKIEDESTRILKLEEYVQASKNDKVVSQVMMELGAYYHQKGNNDKAVEYYSKVIDKVEGKPMYVVVVNALAPIYIDMGKFSDASDLYLKAAGTITNNWSYLFKLQAANAYELAKDGDKAKTLYKELIDTEKTPPEIKAKAEEQLLWMTASKS